MLRWGLDWLMDVSKRVPVLIGGVGQYKTWANWGGGDLQQAHPTNNTLIVQVGDAKVDNNYWGGDQNIPQPRPSYQINASQ